MANCGSDRSNSQVWVRGLQRGDNGTGGTREEIELLICELGWNDARFDKEGEQHGHLKPKSTRNDAPR